jgi:hypothetical protein
LHAEVVRFLHFHHGTGSGHYRYHPYLVGIAYGSGEVHIGYFSIGRLAEKTYGTAELKIMFYIGIFCVCNFYY